MKLSEELSWRGFVNQTTFDDTSVLDGDPIAFYFGVDPSGFGMQIGNLAAAIMVRHFINHGHNGYVLVGGATGMIGDPDGKKDERNLKTLDEIAKNKAEIARQYSVVLSGKDFTMVDNYDWFKNINYLDFLRDFGKYVPMSGMLGRDFVQSRLGEGGAGISYAEFSYALIQGYDYLHLQREYGVKLQLCGADQWGNSIAGVDLNRRLDSVETHVYTMPLILNKTTGAKFGKTEGGAIWLDASQTSVYKFYQFWLNTDDGGVVDYLKLYTFLEKDEIEAISARQASDPQLREAQNVLAERVTALVHGEQRMESVKRVSQVLFGEADFGDLNDDDLDALAAEIPTVPIDISVVDALQQAGLVTSGGEARRLITGGAISVNGLKITEDMTLDQLSLVKKGKNSFTLVR